MIIIIFLRKGQIYNLNTENCYFWLMDMPANFFWRNLRCGYLRGCADAWNPSITYINHRVTRPSALKKDHTRKSARMRGWLKPFYHIYKSSGNQHHPRSKKDHTRKAQHGFEVKNKTTRKAQHGFEVTNKTLVRVTRFEAPLGFSYFWWLENLVIQT